MFTTFLLSFTTSKPELCTIRGDVKSVGIVHLRLLVSFAVVIQISAKLQLEQVRKLIESIEDIRDVLQGDVFAPYSLLPQ